MVTVQPPLPGAAAVAADGGDHTGEFLALGVEAAGLFQRLVQQPGRQVGVLDVALIGDKVGG